MCNLIIFDNLFSNSFTDTRKLDQEFLEREKNLRLNKFMLLNRDKLALIGKKGKNRIL